MEKPIEWADIKATKQFKILSKIQQKICLKKSSVDEIRHGVACVGNIGWETYIYLNQPTYINRLIIKELSEC